MLGQFLALAEAEGCEMVSTDDQFVRKLHPAFPLLIRLAVLLLFMAGLRSGMSTFLSSKIVVTVELGKHVLVVLDRGFVRGLGVPERRLP